MKTRAAGIRKRLLALAAMAALAMSVCVGKAAASEFEVVATSFTTDFQFNASSVVYMQGMGTLPGTPGAPYTSWGGSSGGMYFDGTYYRAYAGGAWVALSTVAVGGNNVTGTGTSGAMTRWTSGAAIGSSSLWWDTANSMTLAGSSLTVNGSMSLTGANSVLTSSGIAPAANSLGLFISTSVYLPATSTMTAGTYYGDGSHLTNISGALGGGTQNAVPYWTSATSLGNSQLARDNSGTSFTLSASSLTVNGAATFSGNVGIGVVGSANALDVQGANAVSITNSANVTISPSGAASQVQIAPGGASAYVNVLGMTVSKNAGVTTVYEGNGTGTPIFKLK